MLLGNHRRTPLRRALALTGAVGLLALTGPVLPAAAQPEPQPPSDITEPPPWDPDQVAVSSGSLTPEGGPYTQEESCVAANRSTSSLIKEIPWSQQVLGYERAHAQGWTGAGEKIAVIDTGVNQHPSLNGQLQGGGSADLDGGSLTDCDGHGTVVAGIAAANRIEGTGFIGMAPGAQVLSIRQSSSVFKNKDGQTVGNTVTMARAVQEAVNSGASVINISQSSCQPILDARDQVGNDQLRKAVYNAYQQNVVVVVAAGNTGDGCQQNSPGDPSTAVLPAWFDQYVLTVASVGPNGAPSKFTVAGPWVDVAAPGEQLVSLDPGQGASGLANQIVKNGQPQPLQGTSFAAPYVSGLAAMIMEKYPEITAGEVMNRIEQTAQHPGGTDGRNDIIGYGMINPMLALHAVIPAEHGVEPASTGPARRDVQLIPDKDWLPILVALTVTGAGIGGIVFTAFLMNSMRRFRARAAENPGGKPGNRR